MLLGISIYAKSYKEAQSYMGPMMIIGVLPVVVASLPGVSLDGGWFWTPLTNIALAMQDVIAGKFEVIYMIPITISNTLFSLACLALCLISFHAEDVIFR